jgi:hypothetical protein
MCVGGSHVKTAVGQSPGCTVAGRENDCRITQALEEYLAALDEGQPLDRHLLATEKPLRSPGILVAWLCRDGPLPTIRLKHCIPISRQTVTKRPRKPSQAQILVTQ